MSSPIAPIGSLPVVQQIQPLTLSTPPSGGAEFGNILKSAVQQVEAANSNANAAVNNFLTGGEGELHSTVIATQKADLEFDMFMQVRNKLVSAYQEIMKMQV